jgi:uncharacterized protein (DUF2267 family)
MAVGENATDASRTVFATTAKRLKGEALNKFASTLPRVTDAAN